MLFGSCSSVLINYEINPLGKLTLGLHNKSDQGADRTLQLIESSSNLSESRFDNNVSRYKIDGYETWSFFSEPNFKSLLFNATGPTDWTKVDNEHNDKVSSVRLIRGRCWRIKSENKTQKVINLYIV